MKKKILYIRENKPGGTDNYCKALHLLFKNDSEIEPMQVEDIPTISSRIFHYYYKQRELRKVVAQADIIHINGYTAMGTVQAFLTAKHLHKRIVYTAHWHPFKCLRHPFLGRSFFEIFLKPVIKRYADTIVTINNEDTQFFKTFHHNVIQIPHWYEPMYIKDQPVKKRNMILFVGRTDDPVKGFEHLYHLPENKFEIHCVGKGNISRRDFHQHINIPDAELAHLYQEASVLVIPSKYEAFSYAALEALSYGTPVVVSEHVRIADYLGGIKGLSIFQYGNYQDFLEKIESAIGNSVDKVAITRIFAPNKMRQEYHKLYLEARN